MRFIPNEYTISCNGSNCKLKALITYINAKKLVSIYVRHLGLIPLSYPLSVDKQLVRDDQCLRHNAGATPDLIGGYWIESRVLLDVLGTLQVDVAVMHLFSEYTLEWVADIYCFEEYLTISTVHLCISEIEQILNDCQENDGDNSTLLSYDSTLALVAIGEYVAQPLDVSIEEYPELSFTTSIAAFCSYASDHDRALGILGDSNICIVFTDALHQTSLEPGVIWYDSRDLQLPRTPKGLRQYLLLNEQLLLEAVLVWRPSNNYWSVATRRRAET